MNSIIVHAMEITQPIGTFYLCKLTSSQVISISYTDVRRLEGQKRDVEEYIGIQRNLQNKRVRELNSYVNTIDASFPNTIILSVSSENATFNPDDNRLTINNAPYVGKVLDGQHRIAGLEAYNQKKDFEVIVAIFIDMEIEDQALLFATINQTQTKVNKSLVSDLFEFATSRSPQKTCHNIARALNVKDDSPFNGKIKILGTAVDKEKETITQATFVESILKYITRDKLKDRDLLKRGKPLKKDSSLLLRDLFIEEKDVVIAQLILDYFRAVERKWPDAWELVRPEYILNKSTGFIALMRFFKDACLYLGFPDHIPDIDDFESLFNKVLIEENSLVKSVYVPGSSGQTKLYSDLKRILE